MHEGACRANGQIECSQLEETDHGPRSVLWYTFLPPNLTDDKVRRYTTKLDHSERRRSNVGLTRAPQPRKTASSESHTSEKLGQGKHAAQNKQKSRAETMNLRGSAAGRWLKYG